VEELLNPRFSEETTKNIHNLGPSKTIQPTNPWCNGGVELHEDKEHDADVRVDDAEEHGDSEERLIEDDEAFSCGAYFERYPHQSLQSLQLRHTTLSVPIKDTPCLMWLSSTPLAA
jgi:hypothetical protein